MPHSDARILRKLLIIPVFALMYLILDLLDTTCIYHYLFGVMCPGCGLTRAWLSFFGMDIKKAFDYNPMFWSVPIIFLYYWKDMNVFRSKVLNYSVIIAVSLGFLANWICNRLPFGTAV